MSGGLSYLSQENRASFLCVQTNSIKQDITIFCFFYTALLEYSVLTFATSFTHAPCTRWSFMPKTLCSYSHSRDTNPPCWRARYALEQDKQKADIILNGNFLCLSSPRTFLALQSDIFFPFSAFLFFPFVCRFVFNSASSALVFPKHLSL